MNEPAILTDESPRHAGPNPVVALMSDELAAGLAAVRRWGGVLSVPAGHPGWTIMGLTRPLRSGCWMVADWEGGWACQVEQGHYGHRLRRPMWLYAAKADMPSLRWGRSWPDAASGRPGRRERLSDAPEYVELLKRIAATVKPVTKARQITAFGETHSVYTWAEKQGMCAQAIYRRLESGYSNEAAVSKFRPSRKTGSAQSEAQPGEPGSLTWDTLAWEEDPWAQRVVAENGPMDLATIGVYFGLSIQRVEELEKVILAKVRHALELEDVLGPERAGEWHERLRGDHLEAYERAVKRAKKMVAWGVVEGRSE